ncbi:DMT family transporter [Alkaliphilus hydrothermalis]|uniref:Transporter family-2 protein n=1 Tax=Alkaliphilus hydrothermalis TaxID=1482730 RepID=A0ABS2NPY0_9FIRM|nr:DMT family transporter [Alkaliphilus hydrothermalis]MBM7614995.1 transporter family-2 protein [Alkaliphilus hydrothermalis]
MVLFYGFLAFTAGSMITLSGILNAQLGTKVGKYKAALANNFLGMITTLVVVLMIYRGWSIDVATLLRIPLWVYAGGLITVAVVVGFNILIPKIPVIYTTILVFTGQFLTALVIDWFNKVPITSGKMIGFVLVFSGLLYNIYFDMQNKFAK